MQSPGLQFVISLLSWLIVIRISTVSGLYFPQSNLTLRFPYLDLQNREVKLVGLRTFRNDSIEPQNVEYRMLLPETFATYQKETGYVVLQSLPEAGGAVTIEASEKYSDNAVLKINVEPIPLKGKNIICADYVQDICFWNTSKYRIYENQPVTMIGTFGPEAYSSLCPEFRIRYELLNGTDYFYVNGSKLFANKSLDRDVIGPPGGPGPHIKIQVRCIIWEETTGKQHAQTDVLHVDILDQDDNPPKVQGNTSISMSFDDITEENNKETLIVLDNDTKTSNQYNLRLIGDTSNAVEIFYESHPIEHKNLVPYTAIVSKIRPKKTLLPESPYRVILQFTDESLLKGYGPNSVNISITFSGPVHRTPTTTAPSKAVARDPLSYPSGVKIARISPKYLRVAEPTVKPHPSTIFALNGSSAFNITQKGGIVYVSNETELQSENDTVQLKLKWSGPDRLMAKATLRVILVTSEKVDTCEQSAREKLSCAEADSRKNCEKSCGIGSGYFSKNSFVGRCVWRGSRNVTKTMTENYSTCTSNLAHCPDKECDGLEILDWRICPQDCVGANNIHFGKMNKNGRGIKAGTGICTCDEGSCVCNANVFRQQESDGPGAKDERQSSRRNRENEVVMSDARKASVGACGATCMIGIFGASLFVLLVIAGSLVIWRHRIAANRDRRECKHRVDDTANGMSILPSDYIDRGDGLLIGLDTFTAANRHLLLPKTCPMDPKWEFPRSFLKIEQALGEGEFGRVLRAKATNIGGMPGSTTVAVKTLKEDACASELADLLSEYQLLKEVQHPNVIRLLGACTSPPGAPVYLIIEFAEFGSLRNYLRRSRHLETESRVSDSVSMLSTTPINFVRESRLADNASNYSVTPRDILSFAWQISKGMSYLTEIKLVHRDLAARNVLLATGKVCKISDFGLTRDVYEDDAYLKRSKGRVPVKWMAPESLADHVYTSKSDVWSFGVLLWELVTLGASPYPGVDVHNLYNLLKSGYRMEKPLNCSQQLYKMMVSCWHQEPAMRPSFKELTSHWERMLEDGVEYLDLNPRTVHNQAYFASLQDSDSPNGSGNDQVDTGTTVKTNTVNYLGRISSEAVTKCDKVDKLQTLWQPTVASFPEELGKSPYVNERSASLSTNHYESPIKLRNVSVTSNSENDLRTPIAERPQSYIDMQGKRAKETEDLLVFSSTDDDKNDNNDVTN